MPQRRVLISFGSVSFAYFAYAGLFGTYAPLWFASLGFSTLAIGSIASLQSATRLFRPYAWAWWADHSGQRIRLLRLAVALSLLCSVGFLVAPRPGSVVWITVALFACTAAVIPISESALAQLVSAEGAFDARRYGRVRVWGSVGFVIAVMGSGFVLQALGVAWFPALVVALLSFLLLAVLRLPVGAEPSHTGAATRGALAVLREPVVAWFFAGVFLTVLAHTSLYAFFSLYLDSLGYAKSSVGLIWGLGVAIEIFWFWFQSRWVQGMTMHGWLVLAALVTALRLAGVAAFGAIAWVLVLTQLTHAVTFAAQHTACIALINQHFPGPLRGRGQALYAVLGYGASGVLGGVAGGALSQAYGFAAVFWAASAAALLAALCCWRSLLLERRAGAA
ncbi:MAG: MFS transporter [Burkholderiales bacterium]|nr:MFS transporter [Burkholderiales bacterium]